MKIKIFNIKSCCGRTSVLLKLDKEIVKEMIDNFKSLGYTHSEVFLKSGILYVSNDDLSLTGPIGSNSLQVGCKLKNCEDVLKNLEKQLESF